MRVPVSNQSKSNPVVLPDLIPTSIGVKVQPCPARAISTIGRRSYCNDYAPRISRIDEELPAAFMVPCPLTMASEQVEYTRRNQYRTVNRRPAPLPNQIIHSSQPPATCA